MEDPFLNPTMALTPAGMDAAFQKLEQAIDAHPKLKRLASFQGEPTVSLSRLGCTVRIPVKLIGSNQKPYAIHDDGDSLETAVEKLIEGLDNWAEALR